MPYEYIKIAAFIVIECPKRDSILGPKQAISTWICNTGVLDHSATMAWLDKEKVYYKENDP